MTTLREAAQRLVDGFDGPIQEQSFGRLRNDVAALRTALAEQPAREAPGNEYERLRALQAAAVMPLIGPLLDAWEGCSQDVRGEHPELDKQLRKINRAMTDAGDVPGTSEALAEQPAAPASIWQKDELEQIIDDYVDDYEWVGEDESGADAAHTPTEAERVMLKDAIVGLLVYPAWDDAWGRHIKSLSPAAPEEVPCKTHPDAPHGFNRNSSHSLHRYVCECEGWEPDEPAPVQCSYPDCKCPFDAPADPNWCARGLPHKPAAPVLTDADLRNIARGLPPAELRRLAAVEQERDRLKAALTEAKELADSEGTRAVEYQRRARKAEAEVEALRKECDSITELNHAQYLALENVRLLAARHRKEDWAKHMLRFCDGAGVRAVHLRQVDTTMKGTQA